MTNGDGTAAGGTAASEGAPREPAGVAGAASGPAPEAGKTVAAVLGEVVWLMSRSEEFKQSLIADLEWLAMPPILLRQFRLFHHGDQPVAAVLYGRVSEEVGRRLDAGAPTMRPQDWQSAVATTAAMMIGGDRQRRHHSRRRLRRALGPPLHRDLLPAHSKMLA